MSVRGEKRGDDHCSEDDRDGTGGVGPVGAGKERRPCTGDDLFRVLRVGLGQRRRARVGALEGIGHLGVEIRPRGRDP